MRYWIGLGANLGQREDQLRRAADALAELGSILARSLLYSSAPVGGPPQPSYINAALCLECALEPIELLAATQEIERRLGRDRSTEVRWGPRVIDIDLLLAGADGELTLTLPGLELPHPRLAERAFALAGIVEHDADLMHPLLGRPLRSLLRERLARGEPIAATGVAL